MKEIGWRIGGGERIPRTARRVGMAHDNLNYLRVSGVSASVLSMRLVQLTTSDTPYCALLDARKVQIKTTTEAVYISPDSMRIRTTRVNLLLLPERTMFWETMPRLTFKMRYTIMPPWSISLLSRSRYGTGHTCRYSRHRQSEREKTSNEWQEAGFVHSGRSVHCCFNINDDPPAC